MYGDCVLNKATLFFFLLTLFSATALFSSSAFAMQELGDAEMSKVWAGQYLVFTRVEPEPLPSLGLPGYAPAMYLETLTLRETDRGAFSGVVTKTPQVTVRDLNGKLWAMERTVIDIDSKPINLWLVINVFKVHRGYFDTGLERYGWEIEDRDYVRLLRAELNALGLTWVDGRPLKVDRIVHQITYNPIPVKWATIREEVYHPDGSLSGLRSNVGSTGCFYRRGYYVVHTY